jgi:hypothetical protein
LTVAEHLPTPTSVKFDFTCMPTVAPGGGVGLILQTSFIHSKTLGPTPGTGTGDVSFRRPTTTAAPLTGDGGMPAAALHHSNWKRISISNGAPGWVLAIVMPLNGQFALSK